MYIKLNSFNCRGLQDFTKRKKIFHYLRSLKSDISFLQETHSDINDENLWKTQWGELAFFASFSSNSRGVAILVRNSINMKVKATFKDPNGRFIILNATVNDLPLTFVNVYGPNNDDPDFFLELFAEIDKFDSFLIVGGDFNAVTDDLDYQGSRQHHSNVKSKEMLCLLIEEYGLCDVWRSFHPGLKKYTRHQKSPRVLSRLDFILVSNDFLDNCKNSKILPGIQSDHSIVSVQFVDNQPLKGKGYWKLNTHYLHHDNDFIKLIKDKIEEFKIIHQDSDCNKNIIWDSFKCFITGVCIEYSARKKKQRNLEKNKLLADIDKVKLQISSTAASVSSDPLFLQLEELQDKLDKIYDFETRGLITRSRVRWLEEGERSSKFFCNLENRAWSRKNITKLMDNGNNLITDSPMILKILHDFYAKLYSIPDNNLAEIDEKTLNNAIFSKISIPKLPEEEKKFLETKLTRNEVYNAVKSMKMNKTPGFDGLPAEFYLVFWNDICDMLIDSFNFSLLNGSMSLSQRNGIITLLPKKDRDPLLVKNYRPITLLSTDYKILAKCIATRLKRCLHLVINSDQSGFMKGRNIGHNIRLILDIIEYSDFNNIPGAILLLDIEKAFDSVSHNFLFHTLKQFNFGDNFIHSIKTLYSARQSFVLNNGFLTESISMKRGIFQGCPISPYLFLFVIEIMALSIRQNDHIKGIPLLNNYEAKISLFADDSVCFLDGSDNSFSQLFETLDNFGKYSGCKINLNKTEAVWIGSKKGCQDVPYNIQGISWKTSNFKCLGVNFSLDLRLLYCLNYKERLKKIEQTINCWRMRNLSLIGKICVIKTLVLPQLIYLFSVLCIKIPRLFYTKLNGMFYSFIWNGGRDRVKRKILCNDYKTAGLKMIDPLTFATAQKMIWVRNLLDDNFEAPWKCIELSFLEKFNRDVSLLWKCNAPESVLNSVGNMQLAESLRSWYLYREQATEEFYGFKFSDLSACQSLWFNKSIRSKSKSYFFYNSWFNKNILTISDLFNPPFPGHKLFEELILDFDISPSDRRKFNFLIKNIPEKWLVDFDSDIVGVHDTIVFTLLNYKKVPKNVYNVLLGSHIPTEKYTFWTDTLLVPDNINWEKVHCMNFFCTLDTKLRSFYFKLFHKSIALNNFLFKIKRKDSPKCSFCGEKDETFIHLFCECDKVNPVWNDLIIAISQQLNSNISITNFEKLFGILGDKFISYLFLLLKYHIYCCKFSNKLPNFVLFKSFVKKQKEIEYFSAKKRGKLSCHFKKWRFDI